MEEESKSFDGSIDNLQRGMSSEEGTKEKEEGRQGFEKIFFSYQAQKRLP